VEQQWQPRTWRQHWRFGVAGALSGVALLGVIATVYGEWSYFIGLAITVVFMVTVLGALSYARYRWVLPFWHPELRDASQARKPVEIPEGWPEEPPAERQ
jgi:hypothetical protein